MANPKQLADARRQQRNANGFDADRLTTEREKLPVKIAGATFTRRRKDWEVSRLMRQLMRSQEKHIASSNRVKARVAELEVEQMEAASDGNTTLEADLEAKIGELVERADEATEDAELASYRLVALLLVAPSDGYGEHNEPLRGFGPDDIDDESAIDAAIGFLQPALDVEDVAALARELSGGQEPDPPTTSSSETGST